jgi:hypothetical protein
VPVEDIQVRCLLHTGAVPVENRVLAEKKATTRARKA